MQVPLCAIFIRYTDFIVDFDFKYFSYSWRLCL